MRTVIHFLNDIAEYIPKAEDGFKQICDNQITIAELDAVIGPLSLNKAPDSDGLTGELLHQVFLEIFETCVLPQ